MRKILLVLALVLVATLVSCGFPGEPMLDDAYPRDIYMTEGYRIILEGDSKVLFEFRPDLDPTKLSVAAKPTMVQRGYFIGYGLPVGGADEELFFNICIPDRWDGESDIQLHIKAWLDTAQDAALDAVKLELNWNVAGVGDVVPAGGNLVQDEIVVGVVPQFTVVEFFFIIDYDIVPDDLIEANDHLTMHVLRAAAGGPEIDGEPVIMDAGVIFQCDKFGLTVP